MAVVDELLRRKQSKDPQAGNGKLSLEDWRCGGSSTSSGYDTQGPFAKPREGFRWYPVKKRLQDNVWVLQ